MITYVKSPGTISIFCNNLPVEKKKKERQQGSDARTNKGEQGEQGDRTGRTQSQHTKRNQKKIKKTKEKKSEHKTDRPSLKYSNPHCAYRHECSNGKT